MSNFMYKDVNDATCTIQLDRAAFVF